MKTISTILTSAVFASMTSVASATPINAPAPTAGVQAFLDVLNSGKGKPIEQMTPQEARHRCLKKPSR
jgi:acetyl esterase